MTTLTLIGAYTVAVSGEELRFITEEVTRNVESAREEVRGLALLEIEVHGASSNFDIGLLHQEGSEQAAYDERYFTVDGLHLLGSDRPDLPDFRVCFFLHYFHPSKKITSPYNDMKATHLKETPARL